MEDNKRFVDTCIKALNERNLSALNEVLATQGIESERKSPEARERHNIRQWFGELHASCVDKAAFSRSDDWDEVAECWAVSRFGTEPAMTSATPDSGMMLVRFAGGKIVEGWLVDDNVLARQSKLSPAVLRVAQVAE